MAPRKKTNAAPDVDVLIVGAGFSGLGLAVLAGDLAQVVEQLRLRRIEARPVGLRLER